MGGVPASEQYSRELERLLHRLSERDEQAFKRLYAATRRKLFSTILLLVKRRYLAEEILQETYVRIWLNAGSYRSSLGSPMVWMTTIARNLAIDVVRKSAREVHCDDALLTRLADECPTALETIEIREEHDAAVDSRRGVLVALEALDPTKRHLVMAAYIDGESRDRLSERYGVPVNTIKTWIRRALIEIRSNLEKPPKSFPATRNGNINLDRDVSKNFSQTSTIVRDLPLQDAITRSRTIYPNLPSGSPPPSLGDTSEPS